MNNEVSIIGLGTRGPTLARRRLQGENRLAIWNGASAKADLLIREDASRSFKVTRARTSLPSSKCFMRAIRDKVRS
jgi:hypothetical protein